MEDKKEGNQQRIEFKLKIRERAFRELIRSKRRVPSSTRELHLEKIEEEDKEVKLENPVKGYFPLSQHQKHHYHHRKKKKCWLCRSCRLIKQKRKRQ